MINHIPSITVFLICFIIVSSGWILVPKQVTLFPEEIAVFIRFLIGYSFLFISGLFCKRNTSPKIDFKLHILLLINGLLSFSINYYLCYMAAKFIPSGLIVLILSQVVFTTMFLEKLIFGNKIKINMILGCFFGLTGILLLTFKDIYKIQFCNTKEISGILLTLLSTLFSALGYILFKKLNQAGLSSLEICKSSMGYATIINFLLCLFFKDHTYAYEFSLQIILSFLYLGIVVSAIAFVLFIELVNRWGATKASYLWTITPAGAIFLSYMFEGYQLSISSAMGILLTLWGGILFRVDDLYSKKRRLLFFVKQKFQALTCSKI